MVFPKKPLGKLRVTTPSSPSQLGAEVDAAMRSKDRVKAKEAVRKFLKSKVQTDWEFTWPPPTDVAASPEMDDDRVQGGHETKREELEGFLDVKEEPATEAQAVYDEHSNAHQPPEEGSPQERPSSSEYPSFTEDPDKYAYREDWSSEMSAPEDHELLMLGSLSHLMEHATIGARDQEGDERRRRLREEASWNPGLACFEARRNAWTQGRTVRVKRQASTQTSPTLSKRLRFWRKKSNKATIFPTDDLASPLSPTSVHRTQTRDSAISPTDGEQAQVRSSGDSNGSSNAVPSPTKPAPKPRGPVRTILPLAPPIMPNDVPMRGSISPALYLSIYDKCVGQGLISTCPINLSDMLKACVEGWKRDGEWPPRSAEPQAVVAVKRRANAGGIVNTARKYEEMLKAIGKPSGDPSSQAQSTQGQPVTARSLAMQQIAHEHAGPSRKKAFRRSFQKVLGGRVEE